MVTTAVADLTDLFARQCQVEATQEYLQPIRNSQCPTCNKDVCTIPKGKGIVTEDMCLCCNMDCCIEHNKQYDDHGVDTSNGVTEGPRAARGNRVDYAEFSDEDGSVSDSGSEYMEESDESDFEE